jgi:hypothetical protein
LSACKEVIGEAQGDENMQDSSPPWILATIFSPLCIPDTVPIAQHGEQDDRSSWKLKKRLVYRDEQVRVSPPPEAAKLYEKHIDRRFVDLWRGPWGQAEDFARQYREHYEFYNPDTDGYDPHVKEKVIYRTEKRIADEWFTIVGNTGFDEGVHYWEVTVKNHRDFMMGVVFPADDKQLNIATLSNHIGNGSELLKSSSIGVRLEASNNIYLSGHNLRVKLNTGKSFNITGSRLGLLLDVTKSELKLLIFHPGSKQELPDFETMLVTLPKGRKFYPAFSLYSHEGALTLNTKPPIPHTISEYMEVMNDMVKMLSKLRKDIEAAEKTAEANSLETQQMREKFESLETLIST